jgi:hypothetical protein
MAGKTGGHHPISPNRSEHAKPATFAIPANDEPFLLPMIEWHLHIASVTAAAESNDFSK